MDTVQMLPSLHKAPDLLTPTERLIRPESTAFLRERQPSRCAREEPVDPVVLGCWNGGVEVWVCVFEG
jgi:hypothetical protein